MHLASLYHDDVMDEADVRRNVDSVNARYGNLIAIVAGDYLMARSAGIAATWESTSRDCSRTRWPS
jgi:heptaprenyl diphosphate synthase